MSHPQRLGKYLVTDVLGKAAMGVVYKAYDPDIQRTVAIKTIRRELVEDDDRAGMLMARFKNEARAAGRLSHPGIVAVYDYGEAADVAFIAMEFVEGNSLRAHFSRNTQFEERDVVSLMAQLLDALQHAHEQGVWHRDIKPANIIIMNSGKLKVTDFGIARIASSSLTQVGAVMGSPGYMAREQHKGDAVDWHADIFAAGVVLYQLVTGTQPSSGSTEQLADKVCYEWPPAPSVAAPGRNLERYDAVVAKALSKSPQDCYTSASEFKAAILEAYAEPVSPTISEETIINEPARVAGILDPSHSSWQTDRSSGGGRTPVPTSTGGDSVPPPRTIPPMSSPPSTPPVSRSLPPGSYGTLAPTVSTTDEPRTGTLAPAQTSRAGLLAWAIAGIAIAVAVGVVAWHAGRASRVPVATAPPTEPIVTRTTELPTPPAPTPSSSAGATDAARAEREAAAANRIAEAQARAEREAAEAKVRAERAATEARLRAEREAAARRTAEAQSRAAAERALQSRSGTPQQSASAQPTKAQRARNEQLAAEARARAEAERTRAAAAAPRPDAAPPATEPAQTPSFFRNAAMSIEVATKLQFNRELFKEEITANVSGGVVTLTGTVSTRAKRELAGKVVREVAGVLGVNNNLKVAGQ